jgi:ATP-binding cassette subfamily F protein 3
LQEYVGAMVLVSHDRSLLRTACDQLFLVERGCVREFDGDLESYRQLLSAAATEDSPGARSSQSRREQRRVEAEARAKLSAHRRPLETKVQRLEKDIESLTQEKERLENLIASPDMYDDTRKEELRQYQFEQARVGERLHLAEERWLELSAQLESLSSGS